MSEEKNHRLQVFAEYINQLPDDLPPDPEQTLIDQTGQLFAEIRQLQEAVETEELDQTLGEIQDLVTGRIPYTIINAIRTNRFT
jgi:hypothetical protein